MGPHDTDVLGAYNRRLKSSRMHLRCITILGLAIGTQNAAEIRDGHYPGRRRPAIRLPPSRTKDIGRF
jgi:hypothetical protein